MPYVYDQELSELLAARGIAGAWPDSVCELPDVDAFYEGLLEDLCRDLDLAATIDWNRCTSIHLTYIEARLYRNIWTAHAGLKILFSRVLPCFIAGETRQFLRTRKTDDSWVSGEFADEYASPDVEALFREVEPRLLGNGLIRLSPEKLDQTLPDHFEISTILGTRPPYCVFHTLFHVDV